MMHLWANQITPQEPTTSHHDSGADSLAAPRTYSQRLLGLAHGDAVHADLNGVPCWTVFRTVCEVQLNGLDRMNGRSERRKRCFEMLSKRRRHRLEWHTVDLLIQHIKELVEHILAEGVGWLRRLIMGHGGEEWAVSPGQARRGVSESGQKRRERPRLH